MRLCVERDELFVLLDRGFGPSDALQIDEKVAAMGRLSRVTVDFSRALDFQHAGLAALARTLTRLREARVSVRGLSLHQTCVLQECVEDEASARA
ncbi:MAG: hypothetical protein HZB56_14940 [Deltaproteobacteria bacterium]|nr:hypothetical protein [Deltaproteobacteria bacterium]